MANGTIAFDTLSTSGQITGTAKSVDTDYLLNGSAKVWVNYKTAATFVNNDSFNVASITDEDAGQALHNFTNAMANANFAYVGMSNDISSGASTTNKTTSTCRQHSYNASNASTDTNENNTIVTGELA
jgi:hypothetical protein